MRNREQARIIGAGMAGVGAFLAVVSFAIDGSYYILLLGVIFLLVGLALYFLVGQSRRED